MEVHQAGGGINFTVERTRAASETELLESLLPRLRRMLKTGTAGAEITTAWETEGCASMAMVGYVWCAYFIRIENSYRT